jgi:glycosyltransferase involved in cell wall biosynthesis
VRQAAIGLRTRTWPPHSHLLVAGDSADWAVTDDARQLERMARLLGVAVGPEPLIAGVRGQSVFYASHFNLLGIGWEPARNRLGVAYLHGRPGTQGNPEFDVCYEALRTRHRELDRIQVPSRAMEELVLEAGASPEAVFRIPIGIELERFPLRGPAERIASRRALGVPESAFVVGSFQKDGVGWGDGLEPKLIKGPDVLLEAVGRAHGCVPELFVLALGPARGYVRAGLERLGVPYRHAFLPDRDAVARAYRALDAYLVTSREEGGPKAVFESMASGVPLVTTRVGQAADLVRHGENGWMVDVGDVDGLVESVVRVAAAPAADLGRVVAAGRLTAEGHSYDALLPRWRALLEGFVAMEAGG